MIKGGFIVLINFGIHRGFIDMCAAFEHHCLMDYKKEMKILEQGRERYFPVMAALMDMKPAGDGSPVQIDDPGMMRIVLELLDIGYLDSDAFIISKKFNEIRGLYFRGGNPLTEKGWEQYMINYRKRRGGMKRRLLILAGLLLLILSAYLLAAFFK